MSNERAEPEVPTNATESKGTVTGTKSFGSLIAVAVVSLVVGAAAGWFGHRARESAGPSSVEAAPSGSAAASNAGPCAALEQEICSKSGQGSALCAHAKGAATLLTSSACERALEEVPAMLAKGNAARAVCNDLVARLCKDLTPTSAACAMVKERTEGFAPERCAELGTNYEAVLEEARQRERRGMIPGAPRGTGP